MFAFENARIDMPCNGVHDIVWCSPFALVLAIDPPSKKTTAIPKCERPLGGLFRYRMGERGLEAALMQSAAPDDRRCH